MAVVQTCPYCKGSMSSNLIWCPHCEKIYPATVTCFVCFQGMNNTEAIVKQTRQWEGIVIAYYHSSCHQQVLNEQTCPTCNYTFSEKEQKKFGRGDHILKTTCPNCGHQLGFFHCACLIRGFVGNDVGKNIPTQPLAFIELV